MAVLKVLYPCSIFVTYSGLQRWPGTDQKDITVFITKILEEKLPKQKVLMA